VPKGISLSSYPNPFNSSVVIDYSFGQEEGGELEIYNIQGQLARTFNLSGKEAQIKWDASDAMGNKICSGIYFAKASASQSSKTIKLLLLK
jgi:flagellar hook assembly protein FlgD